MLNFYNRQYKDEANLQSEEDRGKVNSLENDTQLVNKKKIKADTGLVAGIWFTKNKILFYRVALGLFIVFDVAVVGFSLWKIGGFLYFDMTKKAAMEKELAYFADNTIIHENFTPQPLQIIEVNVYNGGTDKVDAVATINNPNLQTVAYFDYYFDFGVGQTETKKGMILPGKTGLVVNLGLDSIKFVGTPQVNIGNFSWHRVSAHAVGDAQQWQQERLDFTVDELEFIYAGQEGGADANIIKFNLTNNTAFSYKKPQFLLKLGYSGVSTGVMLLTEENFMSLEKRPIDLRNFVDNLQVNTIELYPVIDVYESEAYISSRK
jgi:hypothetical protein